MYMLCIDGDKTKSVYVCIQCDCIQSEENKREAEEGVSGRQNQCGVDGMGCVDVYV